MKKFLASRNVDDFFYSCRADIPEIIFKIADEVNRRSGAFYVVGGWPRDRLLGLDSPDLDFEVYGFTPGALKSLLKKYGKPELVGKSFGVFQMVIEGRTCDFALPRRELKTGPGHRDFSVSPDPKLSFKEATRRRDFTINSMGVKLPDMKLVDPNNGFLDLKKRVLRHISAAFSEDPLRALRAVQFAARFEFDIASETVMLCRRLPIGGLSKERVFEEFRKLLLLSKRPGIGFIWMKELDLLKYFPELASMVGVPQEPLWHPEGDVWSHTIRVVDEAAKFRTGNGREDIVLMLAALCHDFGKVLTTERIDGKLRSPGHEKEGAKETEKFLARLTDERSLVEDVASLVREHLKPWQLYCERERVSSGAIRRLSMRVNVSRLVKLAEVDWRGKGDDAGEHGFAPGTWLIAKCSELSVLHRKPVPYLTGKVLLALGMKPGKQMGELIKEIFELQLDGKIESEEDALSFAREKLSSRKK